MFKSVGRELYNVIGCCTYSAFLVRNFVHFGFFGLEASQHINTLTLDDLKIGSVIFLSLFPLFSLLCFQELCCGVSFLLVNLSFFS